MAGHRNRPSGRDGTHFPVSDASGAEVVSSAMPGNRPPNGAVLHVVESPKSEMLCRLQRKEITLGEYLDHCADQAVEHLGGRVSTERLAFLRRLVREQMVTDPVLVEDIRQTTGLNPDGSKAL